MVNLGLNNPFTAVLNGNSFGQEISTNQAHPGSLGPDGKMSSRVKVQVSGSMKEGGGMSTDQCGPSGGSTITWDIEMFARRSCRHSAILVSKGPMTSNQGSIGVGIQGSGVMQNGLERVQSMAICLTICEMDSETSGPMKMAGRTRLGTLGGITTIRHGGIGHTQSRGGMMSLRIGRVFKAGEGSTRAFGME